MISYLQTYEFKTGFCVLVKKPSEVFFFEVGGLDE